MTESRIRLLERGFAECGSSIHNQIRIPKSAIRMTSSLRIVSSRSDPVDTIAARTPDTSSSRAM